MSVISGVFTLPLGFALRAYWQLTFEFPPARRPGFSEESFHKSDPRYESLLQSLPGKHIKTAMQPFLDTAEVRDLIFVEARSLGFCTALGVNMFQQSDRAVVVAPGFYEADRDACSWTMKHEISHIKNNDLFTMPCVPFVCQLAAAIFGMCSLSFWAALGLSYTVGIVSQALFSQWREAKADDFAIENSSNEELLGGRRLLKAMQEANIEERNTLLERIIISSSGDNRLDILHPSLISRIQKIERALRTRHCEIDVEAEQKKIDGLKAFMADKKREIKQAVERNGGTLGVMLRSF